MRIFLALSSMLFWWLALQVWALPPEENPRPGHGLGTLMVFALFASMGIWGLMLALGAGCVGGE